MAPSDEITVPDIVSPGQMLLAQVIRVAAGEVGVRESGGRNRGPRVDEYIRSVGLDPAAGSYAWCMCFVFWSFEQATRQLHMASNPCVRTAGVLAHWSRAPEDCRIKVHSDGTVVDPERIKPGCVFIHDSGEGHGHAGLVEGIDFTSRTFYSLEGNTDASGGREGDGVWRRTRPIEYARGFVDYSRAV